MSWHIRSVRARVLLLVLVPVLLLFGLYLFTAFDAQAGHQLRVADPPLLLFGGLGLLTVVASIIVSLVVGRGLVRELSDLRRSAEDLADQRLPPMAGRPATGEEPDVAEDPLDIKVKTSEIAQVRDAFARVQRTVVNAAVGQARLRESVGEVFRNVARRNQSLLHRQLALLDGMERRTEDPHELEDLFRIDHLATCMRRHAESLIILSGQSPARGWRNPVPFVDVIRAAVAEVEDYPRVSVISAGDSGLAGPAVGDVIHMIAELVENATTYSPPNTPVVIQGGIVGQGFAVEIEDRGLGMSDDKLTEANASLADPLPFELANTDQLGLLVAGRLAKRHNIQITLRRNPYGGTTAIVLIPHGIVAAEGFGGLEPAKALEGAPPIQAAAADAPVPAYQAAPPAAPAPRARNGANPPMLPRRVRQASLAPQLRDGPPAYTSLPGRFPGPRSPEELRATVSAIQHGSERGRPESGAVSGMPQESGAAGAGAADSGDAGGAGGTGSG